ncbi:toxin-antitoxin system YwqK family antitoxin [Candidatus Spongiihabitans sp.]|uniref:toxin-antitoxin system YwqK family antitoxin n=1 Tax=Candidatus Spongiihabitans sp. TaxID=3101308 RepID=UPI003C6FEE07
MKKLLIVLPLLVTLMSVNATAVTSTGDDNVQERVALWHQYPIMESSQTDALTPKCRKPTRAGDPDCWLELDNQPNCFVWSLGILNKHERDWYGECRNGVAEGRGVLLTKWRESRVVISVVGEGKFRSGKAHEKWTGRFHGGTLDGIAMEGSFSNGEVHGKWTTRYPDGEVETENYVNGVQQ